ncbi:MAG: hypothetical protein K0Q72_2884 [Armatimonadetes bacterium]|jgi:hypothetical protein|nr:hypothetical protein [Armatimonadota bacterium]
MPSVRPDTPRSEPRLTTGRRHWTLVFLTLLLVVAGVLAWPHPHGWQSLGAPHGRIRFVLTRSEASIEPPVAPDWIRKFRSYGIPWPTDLPLEPIGASFGSPSPGGNPAAWYLIQSAQPSNELWHVEKTSVKLKDAAGKEIDWPGGSGAVLVNSDRRLQFIYLGVPSGLSNTGCQIQFRLSRFDGPTTDLVTLPF